MNLTQKYLSFIFLGASLAAPLAVSARTAQEVVIRRDANHRRYYDRVHRDYHQWNDGEDRNYRTYLGEQHRDYREFHRNNRREQRNYWRWRHEHPDHD